MASIPHCDQRILHAPGACEFCDEHPQWQEARKVQGIAFTGEEPEPGQLACPSSVERSLARAELWGGNVPHKDGKKTPITLRAALEREYRKAARASKRRARVRRITGAWAVLTGRKRTY